MSIKNVLLLTVLVSFVTCNFVQGEIIRGVHIPRINITGIVGKWYMVGSTKAGDQHVCVTNIVKQQSERNITMNLTGVFYPVPNKYIRNNHIKSLTNILNGTMKNDSNVIFTKNDKTPENLIVIFDVDYDSYMAMYTATSMSDITSGNRGLVFILSRKKIISKGILKKVKKSIFYQQGVNPASKLIRAHACQ